MDELDFHYNRFIGKIVKNQNWWNPALSWDNKYISKSKLLKTLFSTVLVFVTDAWHFFKSLFLSSIILIILLIENQYLMWWQYVIEFLVVKLLWGIVYESGLGLIGYLSGLVEKWKKK